MTEYSKYQSSLENEKKIIQDLTQASNPLSAKVAKENLALTDYIKSQPRQKYDSDITEIIEIVRILNNMAPIRMPIYNFNINHKIFHS